MGLKLQKGSKQLLEIAPVNGVILEIPYGPVGIIPAPRAKETGKKLHVFTNFLFGHLNLIPSLFQRFSHGKRARAIEAHDRVEITDHTPRRIYTLPEGHQQRAVTDGVSMQKSGLILAKEAPFIFWQFK
jgi:ABC-type cobalamin/Fe3+-siderophores transport system ATPase subunit